MNITKYDTQDFTDEQENAINELNDSIVKHFKVMGVDPEFTEDVWNCIDEIIRSNLDEA